jgi:hypothetical protein
VITNEHDGEFWTGADLDFDQDLSRAARWTNLFAASRALANLAKRTTLPVRLQKWRPVAPLRVTEERG